MCTVSIIPIGRGDLACAGSGPEAATAGFRMACNRDELRSRALALPPSIHRFGARRAILPVDPESGGTWVAVSDAGVAMTLLNGNPAIVASPAGAAGDPMQAGAADLAAPPGSAGETPGSMGGREPAPPVSRGTIIPALLSCPDAGSAARGAAAIDPSRHRPFRLVIADLAAIFEIVSDGVSVRTVRCSPAEGPLIFASSGLGDHLVQGPRREMFESLLGPSLERIGSASEGVGVDCAAAGSGDLALPARQDAFHRLRLPDRPHASTCISRTEAHTVSHTAIEVLPGGVTLAYHPGAPDRTGPTHRLTLAPNPAR